MRLVDLDRLTIHGKEMCALDRRGSCREPQMESILRVFAGARLATTRDTAH